MQWTHGRVDRQLQTRCCSGWMKMRTLVPVMLHRPALYSAVWHATWQRDTKKERKKRTVFVSESCSYTSLPNGGHHQSTWKEGWETWRTLLAFWDTAWARHPSWTKDVRFALVWSDSRITTGSCVLARHWKTAKHESNKLCHEGLKGFRAFYLCLISRVIKILLATWFEMIKCKSHNDKGNKNPAWFFIFSSPGKDQTRLKSSVRLLINCNSFHFVCTLEQLRVHMYEIGMKF